jgi:hypothetical protein
MKMHLASEVSSTTNPSGGAIDNNGSNKSNNSGSHNNTNNNNSMLPLTAETLAERTLEGLMAEHPGELVRTGSPHVVSTFLNEPNQMNQKYEKKIVLPTPMFDNFSKNTYSK